ncbi:MAG: hydrogenase maturation nickel metallochaperone HypA [Candidatus Diapherotrites archaeon]|uniref:Hydrogenase maturation nickel metallochaperone HypA n=1 Tax=Candidatus Iainarchaeum sp. TaxID=3101447 RepID=A0A939C7E7_9ARCH|nr:hydrogenase maturation nickel metallochaperone HypA [Candidatus Diapherotrites archaeon]
MYWLVLMHDFSIVQAVVNAVLERAKGRPLSEVEISLAIGRLKHLHDENLLFWVQELLRKEFGQSLRVKLRVEGIDPEIECGCGFRGKVKDFKVTHEMAHQGLFELHCPKCKGTDYELLHGNDAKITEIKWKEK